MRFRGTRLLLAAQLLSLFAVAVGATAEIHSLGRAQVGTQAAGALARVSAAKRQLERQYGKACLPLIYGG